MSDSPDKDAYWKANLRLIAFCAAIWVIASLSAVLMFRTLLSGISVAGLDLSHWLAQHGSILIFLGLIGFYVWRMRRMDDRPGDDEP